MTPTTPTPLREYRRRQTREQAPDAPDTLAQWTLRRLNEFSAYFLMGFAVWSAWHVCEAVLHFVGWLLGIAS